MSSQPFPARLLPTDTFRRQRHPARQPPAGRVRGVAGPGTGRVRGVRLPQRQGLPLPREEQLHLPEREQHLPLELTWRLRREQHLLRSLEEDGNATGGERRRGTTAIIFLCCVSCIRVTFDKVVMETNELIGPRSF